MLNRLIDWSVANRLLVVLGLLAALGAAAALIPRLNLDAFPLDRRIDDLSRQTKGTADTSEIKEDELERRKVEFALAAAHLGALLAEVGLEADGLDEEFAQWLETIGNTRSVRNELKQLKIKRTKIDAEIDREREAIFKFLSRQGEAPDKGYADLDTLAEGIQRLMDHSGRSDL